MEQNPFNPCGGKYGKSIDVKFINECNGHCAFCIEKGGYCPKDRNVYDMIKSINSSTLKNYKNVLILGGEPMLDPNGLLALVRGLDYDKMIYVTTNGTPISDWYIHLLGSYLEAVNISIMHYDFVKNMEIMGVSTSKEKLISMIEAYHKEKVLVRINCNFYKGGIDNTEDFIKMLEYGKELGADEMKFCELQNVEEGFVKAKDIMEGINENPFEEGCEQTKNFPYFFKGNVIIKTTCGFCNKLSPKPKTSPTKVCDVTKVVYCDGAITDGWVVRTVNKSVVHIPKIFKKDKKVKKSENIQRGWGSHCGNLGGHCG